MTDKKELSALACHVVFEKGTERPFSSPLNDEKRPGEFACVVCGAALFTSDSKYNSGSGWPSFFKPAGAAAVAEDRDLSHGMVRTEIHCQNCGAHLGHVFPDGPKPTGLRYCINGAALDFKPDTEKT